MSLRLLDKLIKSRTRTKNTVEWSRCGSNAASPWEAIWVSPPCPAMMGNLHRSHGGPFWGIYPGLPQVCFRSILRRFVLSMGQALDLSQPHFRKHRERQFISSRCSQQELWNVVLVLVLLVVLPACLPRTILHNPTTYGIPGEWWHMAKKQIFSLNAVHWKALSRFQPAGVKQTEKLLTWPTKPLLRKGNSLSMPIFLTLLHLLPAPSLAPQ